MRYPGANVAHQRRHESASRNWVAAKLALLKDYEFAGAFDPDARYGAPIYFVPDETLVGLPQARKLGIYAEDDLFGGVVPYPFIATKTITHPLVGAEASAPEGWSHAFGTRVRDAVFPGFSAFTVHDARIAAQRILERGPARIKPGRGIGGHGQKVVSSTDELEALLGALDPPAVSSDGIVIEWNLAEVTTYSVGQVRVSDLVASYCGTQRMTTNAAGVEVYGGSDLTVVRGGYGALSRVDFAPEARLAIEQARKYDAAAFEEYPGFLASRRNYDVAQGVDGAGRRCSGVLEQSWRIGGASPAEVTALEAFRADPELRLVRASAAEVYGEAQVPREAVVLFSGADERVGRITKYVVVEPYGDAS